MARVANILCPIDFSEFSRCALDRAVRLARLHNAVITAIHVVEPNGQAGEEAGVEAVQRQRDEQRQALTRFVAPELTADVQIRHELVEAPSISREILVQANRLSADLIVMGTHGRSGVERLLLGSIADKVTRMSPIPVLTVPRRAEDAAAGCPPFQRILCAIDFSEASDAALKYVSSIIEEPTCHVMILHVVEMLPVVQEPLVASPFDLEPHLQDIEAAAHRLLHKTVPERLKACSEIEEIVAEGKPYVTILDTAAERKADLIVIGAHGPGSLDRLRYGSTTSHVVRRASCPVLTVRQAVENRAPAREKALTS
ncbi:MAG TPA: universal stress protein [Vicinamibacterales bacterium]|nr:universal stress protein [Vicinamibacterales bacterium]